MASRKDIKVIINKRIAKGLTKAVALNGVRFAAAQAENEVIDILSLPPERSGVRYKKGFNTSSAPGESPAPISGQLRQSVVSFTDEFGDTARAVVGSPLKYGAYLQFGTDRVKPRPWISRLNEAERWGRILKAFRIAARKQYQRARGR